MTVMSARRIAAEVNGGQTRASTIVESALRAMTALDTDLHFVADAWLKKAQRLADLVERRPKGRRGVLAGVPIMIKLGTGLGTPLIERLVAAGAVPIGVSTRPDPRSTCQAWGWIGVDHTRNPWRLDRSSGGSSAGSAVAVAAGVVPLATGGDSAGSLRIPAAFCGIVGMKGTLGRVPRAERSLAQLTCSGVVAADLDDLITAVEAASGSHPHDPLALPSWRYAPAPSGVPPRVAFSADLGFAVPDAPVAAIVRRRLEHLHDRGVVHLVDAQVQLGDPTQAWLALYALDRGERVEPAALAAALEYRQRIGHNLAELFSRVDILVTPTTPQTAFPCGDYEQNLPAGDLCWMFNISGHPAITVPVGLIDDLPVGAQVVAAPHCDDAAIAAGQLITIPLGTPPVHASHLDAA